MKESVQTVLVTGATGFLGEYVVRRLVKHYRVLALGRNRECGRELERLGAVFCEGDFTRPETCEEYFHGVWAVIHAGALSTVWGAWPDFYETNVKGTEHVARLCEENRVRRLVYLSSPSIYTDRRDQYDVREEQAPAQNDLNFYIRSKIMAEQVIRRWQKKELETVILRPRGLIGIGDTSLVPRLLRANSRIGIPLMQGGHNLVDLTCVENVALACELAITAEAAAGQVFNITNGEPTEFRKLLEYFLAAVGEEPHYRKLPFPVLDGVAAGLERVWRTFRMAGEPPLTRYTVCTLAFAQTLDISRAREILGYRPEKTLKEAIREYGAWWRAGKTDAETAGVENAGVGKAAVGESDDENAGSGKAAAGGSDAENADAGKDTTGKITRVVFYRCGSCTNQLQRIFRGHGRELREFPARATLIRHRERGYILYDTGYSRAIYGKGIVRWLYRTLNPVSVTEDQLIRSQLAADGIDPDQIRTIILSHAHPDHIGGINDFHDYELIAEPETLAAIHRPSLKNLVFSDMALQTGRTRNERTPGMEPEGQAVMQDHFLCRYFDRVCDLFGDGSVIGVRLDGHCSGQLGLWIPDCSLFLAADASWGQDLVKETGRMRWLPRRIQKNYGEYKKTLSRICRMKREHPEIRVAFSHQK